MGESTDDRKPVGTWFGPNTVAQVRWMQYHEYPILANILVPRELKHKVIKLLLTHCLGHTEAGRLRPQQRPRRSRCPRQHYCDRRCQGGRDEPREETLAAAITCSSAEAGSHRHQPNLFRRSEGKNFTTNVCLTFGSRWHQASPLSISDFCKWIDVFFSWEIVKYIFHLKWLKSDIITSLQNLWLEMPRIWHRK